MGGRMVRMTISERKWMSQEGGVDTQAVRVTSRIPRKNECEHRRN